MMRVNSPSAFLYVAMSVICSQGYGVLPELCYLLRPEQIEPFVRLMGGKTIKVPPPEEFRLALLTGVAAYLVDVEKRSWDHVRLRLDLDARQTEAIKKRHAKWRTETAPEDLEFLRSMRGAVDV